MKIYSTTQIPNSNSTQNRNTKFTAVHFNNPEEIGAKILKNHKLPKIQKKLALGETPKYMETIGKIFRKNAYKVEHLVNDEKTTIERIINAGNIAKEAVCMVVYPLQVLTNPDLSKDKRRFVGFYDFYVTCFSLGGAILYAWKGDTFMKNMATKLLKKSLKGKVVPRLEKATKGGAFVIGIGLQTILFKRVIAPALSPPLASKTRRKLEELDAKKEKSALKNKNTNSAAEQTKEK